MSFENLDQNFEKVAQKKNEHTSQKENDAVKHFEQNHKKDKPKYENSVSETSGLLSMFQKKLAESSVERIRDGSNFDTINITSDNITKTSDTSTGEEVSEENIDKLLKGNKKQEPNNISNDQNPISNLVVEQTNVQIVSSEDKTDDIKSNVSPPENLVVNRKRYGDDYPEINKRAQTSDGLSQQAIIRAANGESPNGMTGGSNDDVDDYISEQLKIHNENKLKKAQLSTDKNSSGSFSETIISDSKDDATPIQETELTEADINPQITNSDQ